ncbi:hypothetical protein ABPG72_019629 [Tetrahymena utriculariae]
MDGKKVLAAEDDAFAMKMFSTMMGALGQQLEQANDGKECLSKYQANPSAYKIIFMDLHMPNMDGYDATKAIREFEKSKGLAKVKIIAMSAFEDDDTKSQTQATGMDGIISKPVKPVELKKYL